jgi:class 3 adenylate cyclase
MTLRRAHIILVDISGYTRFIRLHRMSLLHAERIITELLESVIQASSHPLVLNKLEGDAALFYAFADGEDAAGAATTLRDSAQSVLAQLLRFFDVFRARERELVSECSICVCDACLNAADLRLKIIAHTGTIIVKRMRQFEEIAGEDVILTHLLLKNSVPADEYLLLTDAFHTLSGPPDATPMETRIEDCGDAGQVTIHLHYPSGTRGSPVPAPLWSRLATTLRLESYTLQRLFGKSARTFRHLPSPSPAPPATPADDEA